MFISKKKHDIIVADLMKRIDLHKQYDEMRKDNQKNNEKLIEILEALNAGRKDFLTADSIHGLAVACGGGYEITLPDNVPVYVEDVLGGKVIKQEATPVTILDEKGKATYGYTKDKADKGRAYKLIQK